MSDTAKLKVLGKIVFHNMMGKAFSQVNISKIEFCPQKIKLKLLHNIAIFKLQKLDLLNYSAIILCNIENYRNAMK